MRRLLTARARRQSGLLLNSSNDRRGIGGVSTSSNHFEPPLQDSHRPAGNLFPDLSKRWPEISTESNRSETYFRLTNPVHSTRLALELDGRAALPLLNFKRTPDALDNQALRAGAGKAIGSALNAIESPAPPVFQETQVTKCQKN